MASIKIDDLSSVKPFDPHGDPSNVGRRWQRWIKSFTLYADSKGLIIQADKDDNKVQRRALLLHSAGEDVQEIFETLADTGGIKDYAKAEKALNDYFIPKVNSTYQNHVFRSMEQHDGETVAQFVTRLRRVVKDCDYGQQAENQIRDQVVQRCKSHDLRRKLLEKGEKLTLELLLSTAANHERVQSQLQSMESGKNDVNAVREKQPDKAKESTSGTTKHACYRCGNVGHFGRDPECPAKGKTCHKCGGADHFGAQCQTKKGAKPPKPRRGGKPTGKNQKRKSVRYVEREREEDEYAFAVNSVAPPEEINVTVGGVVVAMLIDSGASTNVIDKNLWLKLKQEKVKCVSKKSDKKLYAYGSDQPLKVLGTFSASVKAGKNEVEAEFAVIDGKGAALLGRETAIQLGVLKLGIPLYSVTSKETIMSDYKEIFEGVGKLKDYQVKLYVDRNVPPVAQPVRRTPFSLRDKVKEKVEELVAMDIIEPVEGPTPWVSPVVVVPKQNDEIRLCVDMRRANEAIIRERYPIPTVDEVLQNLNQSTVFSKLDLKWGYHQLELHPDSRSITTFTTHCGLYRYKRLMFGISSAPEVYQHVIQQALQDCEGVANISDDIIVHGRNTEEHDKRLQRVLERLKEKNLTLNAGKCRFHMTQMVFMGLVLTNNGIGPAEDKVKAIVDAREPQSASEVRSFLGLANYNARFIPDFATVAEPLRRLTKKGVRFEFGDEQRKAFNELKMRLSSAETLGYFDKDAKTLIIADASPVGLGAILIQEQQGRKRVISYASKSLSDVERRYSQTEKEALAVVWACERFHVYLYGIEFELYTDHKPLETIYSSRSKPCARIERWILRLQPYKFKVKYLPGEQNIADPLSRLLQENKQVESSSAHKVSDEFVRFVAVTATPRAMTTREIEEASSEDREFVELHQCIKNGNWKGDQHKQYIPVCSELCVIGKLILRDTRIVIPTKLRPQVLSLAHEGHPGIVSMKQRLRSKVWWPGIDREAERFCKTCHGCQLVSSPSNPEPIKSTPLPSGPWQDLAIDLLGPLPSGDSVLVVVDYFSRYYEVEIMRSTTSEKIIECLEKIFTTHGLPLSLRSDNGPQFSSDTFEQYLKDQGIEHRKTTPLWPQANGEVERQNKSLLKRMRIAQAEGKEWKKELRKYLVAYRSTPHTTTGVSPAELLFGRKMRTKLPELREESIASEMRDRDGEMKAKAKQYADKRRNAQESDLTPGDKVLVRQERRNKLSTPFAPEPYDVISKNGNSVVIESPEGVQSMRNTTHVKKYEEPSPSPDETTLVPDDAAPAELEAEQEKASSPIVSRPSRVRKLPERFKDFDLT